jgi:ribonuclease HI
VGDLYYWIDFNMSKHMGKYTGVEWKNIWSHACHQIWYWRNRERHEETFSRPSNMAMEVLRHVHCYQEATRCIAGTTSPTYGVALVGWKCPQVGWVKLNSDGACRKDGRSGCGGVIRGSDGEWLGGFAKYVGRCSVFVAELWGVYEGLKYVKNMGFTAVEVNVDSLAVVEALKRKTKSNVTGGALINRIRQIMNLDWEVDVQHAYRESNQCADALANEGCSLCEETQFFEECPPQMNHLVTADMLGISVPRIVAL